MYRLPFLSVCLIASGLFIVPVAAAEPGEADEGQSFNDVLADIETKWSADTVADKADAEAEAASDAPKSEQVSDEVREWQQRRQQARIDQLERRLEFLEKELRETRIENTRLREEIRARSREGTVTVVEDKPTAPAAEEKPAPDQADQAEKEQADRPQGTTTGRFTGFVTETANGISYVGTNVRPEWAREDIVIFVPREKVDNKWVVPLDLRDTLEQLTRGRNVRVTWEQDKNVRWMKSIEVLPEPTLDELRDRMRGRGRW